MTEVEMTAEQIDRERRLKWFRAAKFGMFIHWGLYAQLGRREWVMNRERIPLEEYDKLADTWKPKPGCIREWAKLAKQAGMRYMVMTTRHHEGFCLFDSKHTDYNAVKRGPGRDLVAEYAEACRAEGLRLGFYYSLKDWSHPDHVKAYTDEAAHRRYIDYTHGLVREIMSNYGKVDILWYDGSWPFDYKGWESEKLNAMVRKLQPDILINNRSNLPEDFGTPEQHITAEKGGRAWESCMTFNDSWGYTPRDTRYKSAWHVVEMLQRVTIEGGNLLLNIGPAPDGSVPEPCVKALEEVGEWLSRNGRAIYDAGQITASGRSDWLSTGGFTFGGNTAYYICNLWAGSELALGGLQNKVLGVKYLGGPEVKWTQTGDRLVLHGLPDEPPDPIATVFEITMDGPPNHIIGPGQTLLEG
jgi:alpha-L-fucosidase